MRTSPQRCTHKTSYRTQLGAVEAVGRIRGADRGCQSRASIGHHSDSPWPTVRVPIDSDADIVVARQQGSALATAMHFSTTDSAFIATTVSELARALLSHTGARRDLAAQGL